MYPYNQRPVPKIISTYRAAICACIKSSFGIAKTRLSHIENSISCMHSTLIKAGERPNATAFGASGSQVSPDSSACPAGLRPFLVYQRYTLPLANNFKGLF
jgi:hypothetical protein